MTTWSDSSFLTKLSIMQNLCIGIVTIDATGVIHYLNSFGEHMLQLSAQEVLGLHIHTIFSDLDFLTIESKSENFINKLIGHHPNGTPYLFEGKINSFIHQNKLFHTILFTEASSNEAEKETQKKLQRTKKVLESFIHNNADSINIIDLEEKVIQVNSAFEKIYGWTADEIVEKKLPVIPEVEKDVADAILQELTSGGNVINLETKGVRKDGQFVDVALTVSPIRDTDENLIAIVTVARDITERKRIEELLHHSDKLSVIGELAAGIAHEIRNPLTALRGFLQLMQTSSESYQDYFVIMLSELDRINFIVSELLVLAKPQILHFDQKHLKNLLYDVITLLETQAILSGVQIITEIESDIPYINCDENQLKQVFINILKNAIEAMPQGGTVTIKTKLIDDHNISISFMDQGYGIPEEHILKLGEPFYTTKDKGTGLGLMVSNKIIRDHLGSISFSSQANQGTTVTVILPISLSL